MIQLQSNPCKPLILTIGEPGGIGPELAIKLWLNRHRHPTPPFALIGCEKLLKSRARKLGLSIATKKCQELEAVNEIFDDYLPVHPLNSPLIDVPGEIREENSPAVIEAIEAAVSLIKKGRARAMITNPINKNALYKAGFSHPGHTEFLAQLARQWGRSCQPVMMLVGPDLKTVPATVHIPLKDVPKTLNTSDLTKLILLTAQELQTRFGIKNPKIAVTGLNPHAGEERTMGCEDHDIIKPAIEQAKQGGIQVTGPHPADTLFHPEKRGTFDVAIAMYHDQALLPVKTLAFDKTVNVTLGLPFIRTSPDHGTALDIAGRNLARPDSLFAALRMADKMACLQQ